MFFVVEPSRSRNNKVVPEHPSVSRLIEIGLKMWKCITNIQTQRYLYYIEICSLLNNKKIKTSDHIESSPQNKQIICLKSIDLFVSNFIVVMKQPEYSATLLVNEVTNYDSMLF